MPLWFSTLLVLYSLDLSWAAPQFKPSNANTATLHVHGECFRPDKILRVSVITNPCLAKPAVVINGTIPGPELRFREGTSVWIRVYNDMMDENVTMHWHGLMQRGSPFSDGTPGASQWPIPPLHYFDYEFSFQLGDAGTYFYHSHVGSQGTTATAPLVIEDVNPPFSYSEERTLFLTDVFDASDATIDMDLMMFEMSPSYSPMMEPGVVALNGHAQQRLPSADPLDSPCSVAVILVEPDRTYRLRLIGATSIAQVYVDFEDHLNLTLMEVDGGYVSPTDVSHVEINSGQRYSVLFKSKSMDELNRSGRHEYRIGLKTGVDQPFLKSSYALLRYQNQPDSRSSAPLDAEPVTFTSGWLEDVLKPLPSRPYEDKFPEQAEITRRVIISVQLVEEKGKMFFIQNGYPWFDTIPPEPYLVSLYKNSTRFIPNYAAALANGGFDAETRTFPAKMGEVLEIVWVNLQSPVGFGPASTHPIHEHGDHVWEAGYGAGPFDAVTAERLLQERVKNGGPIKRDTSNLYGVGEGFPDPGPGNPVSWRAWRIRVRNPGVWMMHCHVSHHMEMGFQTVWVFGGRKELTAMPHHTAAAYLKFGGDAYGNASYSPTVVHYWHA